MRLESQKSPEAGRHVGRGFRIGKWPRPLVAAVAVLAVAGAFALWPLRPEARATGEVPTNYTSQSGVSEAAGTLVAEAAVTSSALAIADLDKPADRPESDTPPDSTLGSSPDLEQAPGGLEAPGTLTLATGDTAGASAGPQEAVIDLPPDRPRASSRAGERPIEPTPQPTPTPRRQIITYRVAEGDTVKSVAQRFGISVQTIVKANNLTDPDLMPSGQELTILPISGAIHVVEAGDTVVSIAERYSVIPEEIIAVNALARPDVLAQGQQLLIPEVSAAQMAAAIVPQPGAKIRKPSTYTVAEGDSLGGIASRSGISVETVLWANPEITESGVLPIGYQLVLLPVDGVLHTVVSGNTLSDVAALHSASAVEIAQVNGLGDPYVLTLGQQLVVPGGSPAQQSAPAPVQPASVPAPAPKPAQPAPQAAPAPRATSVPAPAPKPAQPTPAPKPAQPAAQSAPPPRPTATPAPSRPAPAPAAATSAGSRIVAVAMQYKGYRYLWGGTSPATGFDCSGYVWYVYQQAGVYVPRDLWGQYTTGAKIARGNLQPGDIVFFENTYKPGLSHDGIYIGGNQFIHAASENTGVIVSALSEPYWAARYLGAGRP